MKSRRMGVFAWLPIWETAILSVMKQGLSLAGFADDQMISAPSI